MDAERWQRVDGLLQSAVLLPPEQQEEFLRQECAGDTDLLEEVRSLLRADRDAGSFLEEPALNAANTATQALGAGTPTPAMRSLRGLTVSHYRVLSRLGSGGMGVIYQAEDIKLGRRVAMKFLPGEVASDRVAFERLQREARAASALDHPNICPIYEFGEHEGQPFIVMQLLEGQTLREWIESASKLEISLRLRRTLELGIEMANGLEAAHQKGIIHRDIKPANIFVTARGDAKILDFGLAKLLEEHSVPEALDESTVPEVATVDSDPAKLHLTRTGTTMGTAYYMSPEQVRGEKLDARTDLFSLGLVLYEMTTGKRAFARETGKAVYDAILHQAPIPVRQLNPAAPAELERIINKALEKDRVARYRSAQELASDLESLRADSGAAAWWRNRKWMAAAAILVALTVSLGVLRERFWHPGSQQTASSTKARRSVTVLGFDNLSRSPDADWLSTGLSQMLATELAAGGNLRLISGENVARAKTELRISEAGVLSSYNLGRLRKNLGTDVVVLGSYTVLGDELRLDVRMQDAETGEVVAALSETGSDKKLFDLVSLTGAEMRQKLGVGVAPTSAESSIRASLPANHEAARLYSQGLEKLRAYDSLEARDLLLKASELDPSHAGTHSALAEAWRNLGYDVKAQEEAQKAVDLSADLSKEDRLWYEGRLNEMHHQWDKAATAYRTLLQSYPDGLEYGLRLASVQNEGGKARDALATTELLRNLPSPFRDDPRIDLAAANASSRLADFKQSLALASHAEQVARVQEVTLVAGRAIIAKCGALQKLGQFQQAVTACEEAYRIFEDAGDRAQSAAALNTIALTLQDQGDVAGAKSKFEEALAIATKTGDKRSEARYTNNLATNLWVLGDLAGSKKSDERSLKIALEVDDKIGATNTLGNIGLVMVAMEDFSGARAKYEEALALARKIGNKQAEASNQIHLAELSYFRGDLPGMTRALEAADSLLQGTGDKRHQLYALFSWGDLLSAQDNLPGAQKKFEEALDISKNIGAKDLVAYSQMALATVATEQGRTADAVALAKAATDEYEAEKSTDFEIQSLGVLSNALLGSGQPGKANIAIQRAKELISKSKDPQVQVDLTTAAARTNAALGTPAQVVPSLRGAIAEARRHGAVGAEFEARLALGQIELKAGSLGIGRSHLEQLAKDAQGRGYLLVARKANVALRDQPHRS